MVIMYERLPTFCYTCGMIGHGRNSCSRSTVAGAGKTPSFHPVRQNETLVCQVSPAEDHNINDIATCPQLPRRINLEKLKLWLTLIMAPGFLYLVGVAALTGVVVVRVPATCPLAQQQIRVPMPTGPVEPPSIAYIAVRGSLLVGCTPFLMPLSVRNPLLYSHLSTLTSHFIARLLAFLISRARKILPLP